MVWTLSTSTRRKPAKQAIQEFERPVAKPVGRPITTWMGVIKKQIENKGIDYKMQKQ